MFMFEFVLPLSGNRSEELVVDNDRPTVLTFSLGEGDTGGTLAVELALYTSVVRKVFMPETSYGLSFYGNAL